MNAETLALTAGIALSLFFSYVPGLNEKFKALQPDFQRVIMLGSLAVTAGVVFGISCSGWYEVGIECNQAGAVELGKAFVLALIANQAAYAISPGAKGA